MAQCIVQHSMPTFFLVLPMPAIYEAASQLFPDLGILYKPAERLFHA